MQKAIRRLKNTSLAIGQAEVEKILKQYMDDLAAMGYQFDWRRKILEKALIGYGRVLKKVGEGVTSRNRKRPETLLKR